MHLRQILLLKKIKCGENKKKNFCSQNYFLFQLNNLSPFLFMTVLTKTFFTLMRIHLFSLSLFSTRHNFKFLQPLQQISMAKEPEFSRNKRSGLLFQFFYISVNIISNYRVLNSGFIIFIACNCFRFIPHRNVCITYINVHINSRRIYM